MDSPPITSTLRAEIFMRNALNNAFHCFDVYMSFIVKKIAREHPGWQDTFVSNLMCAVGCSTKEFVEKAFVEDEEFDTYVITSILCFYFKRVYLPCSTCSHGDDEAESLRNAINHVGYTRQLLSHNGRPSVLEMISCVSSVLEILEAFGIENPHADKKLKICELSETAQQIRDLCPGSTFAYSLDEKAVTLLTIDRAIDRLESLLNPCMDQYTGSIEQRDIQEMFKILQKEAKAKTYKECAKRLGKLNATQIADAADKESQRGGFFMVARRDHGLTEDDEIEIRLACGEGKKNELRLWPAYSKWNFGRILKEKVFYLII